MGCILRAPASASLAPRMHSKLDELLARNAEERLSESEQQQLDSIIQQIDELNLLKARAEYTLRHQEETDGS